MKSENQPKTILLVEDEALIAMSESAVLEGYGYDVVTVLSGEKAIETAAERHIDLILMDIDLGSGRMDGTEAARIILRDHDIPVVFLSGHTDSETVEKTEKITSYGYVVKNSGHTVLNTSIKMAFRLREANIKTAKQHDVQKDIVLNSSTELIAYYDTELRIIWANKAAEQAAGCGRGELAGRHCYEIWQHSSTPCIGCPVIKARDTKVPCESEQRTPDGKTRFIRGYPVLDENENVVALVEFGQDISEKKGLEEKVRYEQYLFNSLMDTIPDRIFFKDMESKFIKVNNAQIGHLGLSAAEQALGKTDFSFYSDSFAEKVYKDELRVIETGKVIVNQEESQILPDGSQVWMLTSKFPLLDEKKKIIGTFGISRDISDMKRTTRQLGKSLQEKDFLMKELNHRVKNNLMMITSLIGLKEAALNGAADLSDLTNQIDAIRIIHEKLHDSEDVEKIGLYEYFADLLHTVFSNFTARPVHIVNETGDITMPVKTAVTLGLILNELATNAIKYGFTGDAETVFSIKFDTNSITGEYEMKVSNSGAPLPENIDFEHPNTLGLRLISALVSQLSGSVDLQRGHHPVFTIRFPMETPKPGAAGLTEPTPS